MLGILATTAFNAAGTGPATTAASDSAASRTVSSEALLGWARSRTGSVHLYWRIRGRACIRARCGLAHTSGERQIRRVSRKHGPYERGDFRVVRRRPQHGDAGAKLKDQLRQSFQLSSWRPPSRGSRKWSNAHSRYLSSLLARGHVREAEVDAEIYAPHDFFCGSEKRLVRSRLLGERRKARNFERHAIGAEEKLQRATSRRRCCSRRTCSPDSSDIDQRLPCGIRLPWPDCRRCRLPNGGDRAPEHVGPCYPRRDQGIGDCHVRQRKSRAVSPVRFTCRVAIHATHCSLREEVVGPEVRQSVCSGVRLRGESAPRALTSS